MQILNYKSSIFFLVVFLIFIFLFFISIKAFAAMEDYCVVPPYVIQDVPPDVILLVDNSGSMYNFAYTCPETETSQNSPSSSFVNQPVYVKSVMGFNVGDAIMVWDNLHGAGSDYWRGHPNNTPLIISSIDKSTNSFIVVDQNGNPASLHYNADQPVVKASCITTAGLYNVTHYDSSFNPDKTYYGYFNSSWYYTYGSSRFTPSKKKSAGAKTTSEWDGNFLNWLTMRRVDVLRKVLTGGRASSNRLTPEIADSDVRGVYKMVNGNTENYAPSSYSGTRCFKVPSGSGNATLQVAKSTGICPPSSSDSFTLSIVTNDPIEGVLQGLAGTRARLGLAFYRTNTSSGNQGGYIARDVRGNNCTGQSNSLPCVVNDINNTSPSTNTPLAEALWSVSGYFARVTSLFGGPGPRYSSGDYNTNNNDDPFNFGTGGQPRYPNCAKAFVLMITDGEPCADGYLPNTLRDYASGKSDYNCSGTTCPSVGNFSASKFDSCYGENNSSYCNGVASGCYVAGVEDVALWSHTTDLRSSTLGYNNIPGKQNLTIYTVFAFGKGSTLLRYAAINGGFEDLNGNNIPDLQSEWDNNGDGEPDNFYEADDGYELEQAIKNALSSILKRAASGTAASVLASGEGSGANLIQAVFYPRRRFGNAIINWTGENVNYWYYVDPYFTNSNIREDTVKDDILDLKEDYIIQHYFDTSAQLTKARRYVDTDGDGDADSPVNPPILFENASTLWKAGQLLWQRDITSSPRTIYTTISGTSFLAGNFSVSNKTILRPYLDVSSDTLAEDVIRYLHGEGLTTLDLDNDGVIDTTAGDIYGIDRNGDGIDDYRTRYATIGDETHVWKLGDVLNSTPRISSWIPLNNYYELHKDYSYKNYINSSNYKNRGMVFAGANDGMLHAFKLGKLELHWSAQGSYEIARLTGTDLGKEQWAFIPKNALPYLKYILDPEYCHIYSVDLSPYIFDASIGAPGSGDISENTKPDDGSTWRTILVGGMRFGGACRKTGASCTDCVKTPILDPSDSSKGLGYSSYFALDVTDQDNPQLLWEFSAENLGFATSGPAIVRIGDKTKNGKWFVVIGSGPTGPIDSTYWQFKGSSDQNLRFFILDLKTGALLQTIDTGIQYAFSSSMLNVTIDNDVNYSDDAIYVGYVKRTGSSGSYTWTDGGIGRIFTKSDPDPTKWIWRTLRDGIGPITSSIGKLQNNKKNILWLYFGSGRYYYEIETNVDDPDSQRRLYGIKDPCFTSANILNPDQTGECQNTASGITGLTDVTSISSVPTEDNANSPSFKGWYINLDTSGNYSYPENGVSVTRAYRSERVITDPMTTTTGLVFFTTYKPYNDECGLGGKSFIWALRYNTGGSAGALLKGVALLQVSTGSVEQLNLSEAFKTSASNPDSKGERRSYALEGVPPTQQGLSLLSTPPPAKRILHIRER